MKPNFALSLSFDGIRMLHRAAAGWHLVGEVSLEADDLAAELAMLRRTALALDARGLRTKLLLPNEQIKYLALDTTRAQDEDVRAALDGATPYAVADLVYDYSRGGGRTYIAAVARETLEEAEAFATEHKLNPVCFAAVPEPFTYMGEVFFGPTGAAATLLPGGERPERDEEPVEIVGRAELPDPEQPVTEPDTPDPVVVPAVSNAGPPPELRITEAPEGPTEAAPPPGPIPRPGPEPVADGPDAPVADPDPEEPVVFASRARPNGGDDSTVPPQPAPLPRLDPPVPDPTTDEAEPLAVPTFRRSADNDAPRTQPPRLAVPVTAEPAGPPLTGARRADTPDAAPPEVKAPAAVDAPPPGTAPKVGAVQEDPAVAAPDLAVAPAASLDPVPEALAAADKPAAADRSGILGRRKSRSESTDDPAEAARTRTDDEARKMTIFGARKPAGDGPSVGGKPRYLGLILTLILLLFMAAVAAMAAISETGFSAWFGGSTPEAETQTELAASPDPDADEPGPAPLAGSEDPAEDLAEPEVAAEATPAPMPIEDESDAALAAITEAVADAAQAAPSPLPDTASADPVPDLPETAEPDTSRLNAGGEPIGRVLTPSEAQRIYAATGVWQRAPRVQVVPRALNLEGLQRAVLDPGFDATRPPALPGADPLSQDLAFIAPADPPPPDLRFDRDEDGFVVATEDGAVTPEGAIVYAGAPEIVPPARPGSVTAAASQAAEEAAEEAPNEAVVLPGLAQAPPPVRPLSETPAESAEAETSQEAVTPGGVSLAAFRPAPRPETLDLPTPAAATATAPSTGLRPAARPEDLVPPEAQQDAEAAEPEEADPLASASQYAVAESLRPDTRPRNFTRVVERAREQQQRQQAAAAARAQEQQSQPARAVAPSGPTTTTVAQAATRTNAINLRQINLIGVYGSPGDRRALVRLGNGRYVKVGVGDRLDGGQVAAIGDSALRYVKRGRNIVLEIPNG